MNEEKVIKLSSKWTVLSMVIVLLLFVVGLPLIWVKQQTMGLAFMVVLSDLILLVTLAFFAYLLIHVCTARISGNKLIMRKLIGNRREIDFKQVEKVSSITMRATKYVFVRVKSASEKVETFIILNPIYMTPAETMDAEKVLNSFLKDN